MFRTLCPLMKSPENLQTQMSFKKKLSRFLVISSTEDGALMKLSSLPIQTAIVGLASEPKIC